jgi:hypothetical protein
MPRISIVPPALTVSVPGVTPPTVMRLEPVVISSAAPTPVPLSVPDIPCLEFPIMHVCNLHCDGCRHDASDNIKAIASADKVRTSVAARAKRINPRMVKILGDASLAHRQLPEIFVCVRQLRSERHIQIITKFGLGAQPEWASYLTYQGIDVGCSDAALAEHVGRGAEPVCGMSPAKSEPYENGIHDSDVNLLHAARVERGGVADLTQEPALVA